MDAAIPLRQKPKPEPKESKATMNNKVNANVATLPTEPKPQTSKEVIAANVKLLIEQLEAGHSEGLTAYLTAMGKFHNYSFGNILEIARQMPSASRVAGMYAWNQLGRRVKKGQKGIRILAPLMGTKRKKDSEAERSTTHVLLSRPAPATFKPGSSTQEYFRSSSEPLPRRHWPSGTTLTPARRTGGGLDGFPASRTANLNTESLTASSLSCACTATVDNSTRSRRPSSKR